MGLAQFFLITTAAVSGSLEIYKCPLESKLKLAAGHPAHNPLTHVPTNIRVCSGRNCTVSYMTKTVTSSLPNLKPISLKLSFSVSIIYSV